MISICAGFCFHVFSSTSAEASGVGQDIYACTSYQEVFLSGTATFPDAHISQFLFSLDDRIDVSRLRAAFDRCADHFPTLRTRIVGHPDSRAFVQLVLKRGTRVTWNRILTDDVDDALARDKQDPIGGGRLAAPRLCGLW